MIGTAASLRPGGRPAPDPDRCRSASIFPNKLLPYLLLAPQIAITLVFFFWPAFQAVRQSFYCDDPFGFSTASSGSTISRTLFADPGYYQLAPGHRRLQPVGRLLALVAALLLAVMADQADRAATASTRRC